VSTRIRQKTRTGNSKRRLAEWKADEVQGKGDFGVISTCRRYRLVTLHKTREAAEDALDWINTRGCGGECRHRWGHRLLVRS
jgi:hypothetical protein